MRCLLIFTGTVEIIADPDSWFSTAEDLLYMTDQEVIDRAREMGALEDGVWTVERFPNPNDETRSRS
jgi:hypothetical protein